MFGRLFSKSARIPAIAIQLGAAAIVTTTNNTTNPSITDKELLKKGKWYKENVDRLENALKELSKKQITDDELVLDNAEDILERVIDTNNFEITWRLGRALVEKSPLVINYEHKVHLLEEAIEHFHKALAMDAASRTPALHKWYAIGLMRLKQINSRNKHLASLKVNDEILEHLKKAVELDANDPISWHFLGIHYYETKNNKSAIEALMKAEELKPNFSLANACYIGMSYLAEGNKPEALNALMRTTRMTSNNGHDAKAKLLAVEILTKKFHKTREEITPVHSY